MLKNIAHPMRVGLSQALRTLNVRLSGPRYYDGKLTDDEWRK